MRIFGKGKCKVIANFSATMVTSLPSLSVSLSVCISLSPNIPHAQYRKRFRASYNTPSEVSKPRLNGKQNIAKQTGKFRKHYKSLRHAEPCKLSTLQQRGIRTLVVSQSTGEVPRLSSATHTALQNRKFKSVHAYLAPLRTSKARLPGYQRRSMCANCHALSLNLQPSNRNLNLNARV